MYWSEYTAGRIRRANLDGSGVTTLLQGLPSPLCVALDLAGGKTYWSGFTGQILRANLDGSGKEILVRNLNGPVGIALDVARGQMYWTDILGADIRRANLDGTGQETLVTGLNSPDFISLDLGAPGTAVYFALAAPASVPPGTPFDVTVTALDPYGNTAVNYEGTVTFTSSDAYPGLLPADYSFTSADQGRHTFSGDVTFFTAGAQRLMAQDIANSSITGSATVAVVAAPASQLLITASATVVSGKPFDVALAALDPYANVDMNYAGTVTWTSGDTDPGVILPADYSFQATDKGSVAFPGGVTLITPGDQTITATDTASGITRTVTVTVVPPNYSEIKAVVLIESWHLFLIAFWHRWAERSHGDDSPPATGSHGYPTTCGASPHRCVRCLPRSEGLFWTNQCQNPVKVRCQRCQNPMKMTQGGSGSFRGGNSELASSPQGRGGRPPLEEVSGTLGLTGMADRAKNQNANVGAYSMASC
jgi:hypothetical protein